MNRLRQFLNLQPGEGVPAFLLFLYLTLVLTSYIVSKSLRDALFLDQFGAMRLPYLYIGVAILIGIIVSIYIRVCLRVGQATLITGTMVFFMATIMMIWWAIRINWQPIAVIYYMWTNIFGIVLTAQVWTLATTALNIQQARRLFPLICSGGVLGSMLGGLIAAVGVRKLGADNVILIPLVVLVLLIPIVQTLAQYYGRRRRDLQEINAGSVDSNPSVSGVLKVTMRTRYLRLIATLLSLSAIVTLIIDFQFKLAIQQAFHSRDAMAVFFGSFYAYVGLFSFLIQFLAGSRILQKYGLKPALLFLPMTLLGGTAALLAYPSMLWAGILKGSDGVLRTSIDKSTIEMLYIPVPQAVKVQVKAVIDMLIQRFSDGIGGILLLVMTQFFGLGLIGVGVVNVMLLMAWIWIARQTRQEYVAAVRETFPDGTPLRKIA
jgi:AAA family ATP:ADP antiporter